MADKRMCNICEEEYALCGGNHTTSSLPEWPTKVWHNCHFCGELVRDGKDTNGDRHWLSDCRPDLTHHEPGPLCTWPSDGACYAEHEKGKHYVYKDGPT